MQYDPFANTAKLQKKNLGNIVKFITGLENNNAVSRGEDIDYERPITQILDEWAQGTIEGLKKSWVDRGFNPASSLIASIQPNIIDKAGVIKALQILIDDEWIWAEKGRKKGKRPPLAPIQRWIAYRGINLTEFKNKRVMVKLEDGKKVARYPYKNLSNIEANKALSQAIARGIGQRGTIKGAGRQGSVKWSGYKGSKFLTAVINQQSLDALAMRCGEVLGEEISINLVML